MNKTTSQFANEIHQMSIKARYAEDPDESKKSRILMTVFLREILRSEQGNHSEIASSLLANSRVTCSKEQAMTLAKAATRHKIDFGRILP